MFYRMEAFVADCLAVPHLSSDCLRVTQVLRIYAVLSILHCCPLYALDGRLKAKLMGKRMFRQDTGRKGNWPVTVNDSGGGN